MKYMGSKREMLQNGLGTILANEIQSAKRFVDLFSGSGAVSSFVACNYRIPVMAVDLQLYSSILTLAIVGRIEQIRWQGVWERWQGRAREYIGGVKAPILGSTVTWKTVHEFRRWCERQCKLPITRAYGGYYFSPQQAICLDALRMSLPRNRSVRVAALAAVICAGSACSASPGHTAQPFQPTRSAKKFLLDSWRREIFSCVKVEFERVCGKCALVQGKTWVDDANEVASRLKKGDLVFIDPHILGYTTVDFIMCWNQSLRVFVAMCPAAGDIPIQNTDLGRSIV